MDTQAASADGATILHRTFQSPGQSGFSILEVLIAIIILSMGMLGAVGMQAAAMQANKETRNQAAAATLGRDLAERMRGNHTIAIKTLAADNPYIFDATLTGIVATPSVNCFTTGCPTVKDAATWDVADWQSRVRTALPTPRVNVCFDKDPFDSAGKPRWVCTNDGDVTVLKMSWTRSNTAGTLEFAANTGIPIVVIPLTAGSSQ
jgi:type IV pilus assembly protein PilV